VSIAHDHAHHNTPRWLFALLLAALAMLGPFAIDTYLPAFNGMAHDLNASPLQMQQTLSVYLAAFAFMFLFHGALSDSYGRKPVIIVGLVGFLIGSLGCALANDVTTLLIARAVQGLSVGAGMVVGRAMIRDLFNETDAQKLMSMVTLWFGVAPAIAPVIGGYLYVQAGWHAIFWFLAAITAILIVVIAFTIHETLPREKRHPFRPAPLFAGYREVGANPAFLLYSLAVGLNFNAFFLYIMSSPVYLPETLKLAPDQFAWLFAPGIAGIMMGAYISGRVAGKYRLAQTVRLGYHFMFVAAFVNLAYVFFFESAVPWAIIPIFFYALGSSCAMPSISLIVLDMFPTRRGMAASLQGFISGIVNAVVAGVLSPAVSHSPRLLAAAMVGLMLSGLACWVTARKLSRNTL
jgi:DHA1 family bicyclomycin/chloramphenicol resistance-like MFS transporter